MDVAEAAWSALHRELVDIPARTVAGLKVKILACGGDPEMSPTVMASIAGRHPRHGRRCRMSAATIQPDQPRPPLFDFENQVRAIVDRLLILEAVLGAASKQGLTPEEIRAVDRLVGEALTDAHVIEAAWDMEHRGAT